MSEQRTLPSFNTHRENHAVAAPAVVHDKMRTASHS